MKKCTNCVWEGEDKEIIKGRFCPICGDNVKEVLNHVSEKKVENTVKESIVFEPEIKPEVKVESKPKIKPKSNKSKRGKR